MKCGECEKSYWMFCPCCGEEIVLCLEEKPSLHPLNWWDKDNGCDGIE